MASSLSALGGLYPDIHRGLRGKFCLRQNLNPLKYHILSRFEEIYELSKLNKFFNNQ